MKEIGFIYIQDVEFESIVKFLGSVLFKDVSWYCHLVYIYKQKENVVKINNKEGRDDLMISVKSLPLTNENTKLIVEFLQNLRQNVIPQKIGEKLEEEGKETFVWLTKNGFGFDYNDYNSGIAFRLFEENELIELKYFYFIREIKHGVIFEPIDLNISFSNKIKFFNWIKQFKTIDDLVFYILKNYKFALKTYKDLLKMGNLKWKKYKI